MFATSRNRFRKSFALLRSTLHQIVEDMHAWFRMWLFARTFEYSIIWHYLARSFNGSSQLHFRLGFVLYQDLVESVHLIRRHFAPPAYHLDFDFDLGCLGAFQLLLPSLISR